MNDNEAVSEIVEPGIGAAIIEITSRTLQGIEGALQRLQSGEYGVCSECGAAISAARLRAVPFAGRLPGLPGAGRRRRGRARR